MRCLNVVYVAETLLTQTSYFAIIVELRLVTSTVASYSELQYTANERAPI